MVDECDRTAEGGHRDATATGPLAPSAARSLVVAAFLEHSDELRRFVTGVARDPDVAGDVMQSTLSKALELGNTARPETSKGWLFRVAFHEALAVRRRLRADAAARRRLADLAGTTPPAHGRPEDEVIREETIESVRGAIRALPDDQRRVVLARVYGDKTFAQIARDAGLPLGTVLTRMRLALDKLRHALSPDAGDGD